LLYQGYVFTPVIPSFQLTRALATPEHGLIGKGGFPHSEICGSKVAHTSPQLIAACHVLHRLCMPRHPRNALTSHLRVRTTNDSAGVDPQRGSPLGTRSRVDTDISISQPLFCAIATRSLRNAHDATASISRTHLQCQSRGQIPFSGAKAETDFLIF
jgi:hypothetical protein